MNPKNESHTAQHVESTSHSGHDERQAAETEKNMSLWTGIKTYPWAIFWSVMMSLIIVMEGYDVVLMGGLIPQPAFQRHFGSYYKEHGYQVSGPWQIGLSNAATCGTIFGALANGWLTQRFGYRKTILGSLFAIACFIFVTFFAQSLSMLVIGQILCGLPWGVFATLAPAYASEICPTALRGYLANFVCLCWAIGMLISSGVQQAVESRSDNWAFRIPFALQWIWPVPLFLILWFAPESPWILVRWGKLEEAEGVLRKLTAPGVAVDHRATVSMMEHTINREKELESGTSYSDCFKGENLRRTEITCLTWVAQYVDGTAITGQPVYFFVQAGVGTAVAYKLSVAALGLSCIGVMFSWVLIYRFGRRSLYVFSLFSSFVSLLAVGIASAVSDDKVSMFVQSGIVLLTNLIRYATTGPVCYAIIAEISAVSIRSKTIALARAAYYLAGIIVNTVQPYLINPTEANLKGRSAFIWSGTCLAILIWAYFRLPETKGRLFEEIDLLFANKVPARHFAKTKVNMFQATTEKEGHETIQDA
ncbi:hypothetical protein LB504_010888 [Fusarium proliferatum]|nr:hypothetical protein LB504_010888 [Fusarium proliferatum]